MSKKANPTTIGLFFVVGTALAVLGLLIFSSRNLFHPMQRDILYFNASLDGLNPGAAVKYRGVTVGSVVEILIHHNQAKDDFSMPVVIAVDKKLMQAKSDLNLQIGDPEALRAHISQGLRARLNAESLLTGVLYIGLDVVPNAPEPVYHQLTAEYHEIPTVPSDVQQLLSDLSKLDLRGLSEKVNVLLTRLNYSLAQLNVAEINAGVTNLLYNANHLVASPDITNTIVTLRHTLDHASKLMIHIDQRVDPLADSITNTLADAQKTMEELRRGVRNVAELLGPDSTIRPDLMQALEDLSNAGRAVANLAEFLEHHPNALVTGRKTRKEQP